MQLLSKLKEELKSQPLISPVPTPTSSSFKKKEEAVVEIIVKTEPRIEIATDIAEETVEKREEEKEIVEEAILEVKIKNELDVQPTLDVDISPRSETSGGSTKTQLEAPFEKQESDKKSDSETIKTGSEERRSSESEPDSDAVPIPTDQTAEDDHERKGLFHQPESLDDELPYVPTTLPQERPVAHPIIPVKQRVAEVKTFPIDRPRSTTPINPSTLDDYVSSPHEEIVVSSKEKMQIVLPR
ncbi:hypothetical protein J6590_023166 [Homalodisca vitripennis]|nr:hypothetical protein J6590_023166 [Homalodisca vitripennis]